ncbi:aldo/keto reductase [Chitinophaga pinensis]|uniref:Aldo/keto reductase n=1 Tax=Chitinophaga pinensis (strain ATCC 43595 / DSM 2588 / LMG 13176 / NBRC 15968 / NCIMB 11800 / UQM 2034) TaxID=485918 RepID=A0A979GT73_CHIPD|nr:aldo/keto reductase [Chitinophaga pinensis]ACU59959.1 aldo/keto reductase [Chitinophaga pinensis DSM 2588]
MDQVSRRKVIKMIGTASLSVMAAPFAGISRTMTIRNSTMLQREIPVTGEKLPVVGLGTWQQFDVGPDASAREPLINVLKSMLEMGGRLIDSSPMYGKAETVVGELSAASGNADKYFYATKVWTSGEQSGIRQMNDSMQKMQLRKMDLMQVHNLQDWQTHLKTMRQWKEAGKIRYTGITHYTSAAHDQLEQIVKSKAVDFVQFNYSIRERNAERSLLKAARDSGVAVIINEPFDSGSLFRMVKGQSLPAWAADYEINSWAQFFLKYILAHPAVTCVIPGTSNPKHLADNMGAGYGSLPDENGLQKMRAFVERL